MKRLNLMVPDSQYDWLYKQSEELDLSVAEIVRRALNAWIKAQSDSPTLFESKPRPNLFGSRVESSTLVTSIRELQQIVVLLEQAVRRTASPETMAAFDMALADMREQTRKMMEGLTQQPPG